MFFWVTALASFHKSQFFWKKHIQEHAHFHAEKSHFWPPKILFQEALDWLGTTALSYNIVIYIFLTVRILDKLGFYVSATYGEFIEVNVDII